MLPFCVVPSVYLYFRVQASAPKRRVQSEWEMKQFCIDTPGRAYCASHVIRVWLTHILMHRMFVQISVYAVVGLLFAVHSNATALLPQPLFVHSESNRSDARSTVPANRIVVCLVSALQCRIHCNGVRACLLLLCYWYYGCIWSLSATRLFYVQFI